MARSCIGVGQAPWCLAQGSGRPRLTAKRQLPLRGRETGVVTEQAGQGLAGQCPVLQDPSETSRAGRCQSSSTKAQNHQESLL